MDHPVTQQSNLEAKLLDLSTQIGALLSTPWSADRSQAIAALWQVMAREYGHYQTGHAAVQPSRKEPSAPPDSSALTNARLTMMRHGAYRAGLWEKISKLLQRQAKPIQTPLLETRHIGAVRRQDDLISYLISAMHHLANPISQDRDHARSGQHLDIPLAGGHFINLMQAAYRLCLAQGRTGPLRFIDVGCGGGTKVIMASHFFDQADGLEYNLDFVANAQRTIDLAKVAGCTIVEGDALTFPNYADYDIVYFYRPISDEEMLTQMETNILDQVEPGTILIAPMEFQLTGTLAHRVAPLNYAMYIAHTSADDAAILHQQAEKVGPDWQLHNPDTHAAFGFWLPIIEASRVNGFCLPR